MKNDTDSWGRPPKPDKATNCVMVRFNDADYARFLDLFKRSGMKNKANFIVARVFDEEFKITITDTNTVGYYNKLTMFFAKFREIGVHYNLAVRALKSNFSERKALALLYKLEKITMQLIATNHKVMELTEEFKKKLPEI